MMKGNCVIALDPGVDCGIAYFSNNELIEARVLSQKRSLRWDERIYKNCTLLEEKLPWIFRRASDMYCSFVCEQPVRFNSSKGDAVLDSGAFYKLSFACGAYCSLAASIGFRVSHVTPVVWKGQLSKDIIRARLVDRLGEKMDGVTSHAVDAVGIGMWYIGEF